MIISLRIAIAILLLLIIHPTQSDPISASKKGAPTPALNMGGSAQGIIVNLPDPKLPGKLLCEIHAESASGQSAGKGFLGQMQTVHARLYQHGVPSATLTASLATANSVGKSV